MKKNQQLIRLVLPVILLLGANQIATADSEVHVVERGDTLYGIARSYNIRLDDLRNANDLGEEDRIYPGQKLVIPAELTTYVVERGDTLFGIARRYNTSVSELRSINRLNETDVLRVGQTVTVPSQSTTGAESKDDAFDSETTEKGSDRLSYLPPAARTASDGIAWPHSGERTRADGKFPGVYIAGERGDPVYSVSGGRVVYSGPHSSFGHVVFVQSSQGYIYVYGGNAQTEVSVGQIITSGSKIGTVGSNPLTQSNSVFFSVWKDNQFLSPETAPRS